MPLANSILAISSLSQILYNHFSRILLPLTLSLFSSKLFSFFFLFQRVSKLTHTIASSGNRPGLFARRLSRILTKSPSGQLSTSVSENNIIRCVPPSTLSPNVQLTCAHALTSQFSLDEQGQRAKVVMQSSPRMPAVGFFGGKYGDRWYVDLVALTHNAVRRQLFDAFVIANALGKLLLDVSESDISHVYVWLNSLHAFVDVVFNVEDRFVYPLIDKHVRNAVTPEGQPVYLPELLSARGRNEARAHVRSLLDAARNTRDVATNETHAKIHALRFALDQFGASILDYFAAMERFAPKLFKKAVKLSQKEKAKLERKMFEFVRSQHQGDNLAALLMQCIESRSRRKDFLERNIKKEKHRLQFKAHVKHVEATHMQLARSFDSVASKYERRFNVRKFMQHYDASSDGTKTLKMFGHLDGFNYEGRKGKRSFQTDAMRVQLEDIDQNHIAVSIAPATSVQVCQEDVIEMPDGEQVNDLVDQTVPINIRNENQNTSNQLDDVLDDDVVEVRATEYDAFQMESRK